MAIVKPPAVVSTGPAVFGVGINTISRRSQSVAGRLVQVWRRSGAGQVASRTISRRSHSVAGRLVQTRAGPAVVSFLLTQGQQAVTFMWRDGWSTSGAGPVLVRLARSRSAGGPILWRDGWSRLGQGRH